MQRINNTHNGQQAMQMQTMLDCLELGFFWNKKMANSNLTMIVIAKQKVPMTSAMYTKQRQILIRRADDEQADINNFVVHSWNEW